MGKFSELIQPKNGENHRLFGVKHLKRHNMRDPNWQATDKMLQYIGIKRLYEQDQLLQNILELNASKKRQLEYKRLEKEVRAERQQLNVSIHGDLQRTKVILQNHKEMQRSLQRLLAPEILEKIDQKTHSMRQKLDRLVSMKNGLTSKYENKLLELAAMQDHIRYLEDRRLPEEDQLKYYYVDLKNSETRSRVSALTNRAYKKIIAAMLKDSIFYEPVLNALKEDMDEQQQFIRKTVLMGVPALKNVNDLTGVYKRLEQTTKKEMSVRMQDLAETRETIFRNNEQVKKMIRLESIMVTDHNRYGRTRSMEILRMEKEDLERTIKELKSVTSCATAQEIYPRIKQLELKDDRMTHKLDRRGRELCNIKEMDDHAVVIRELLQNDLTEEELETLSKMEALKSNIVAEQQQQEEVSQAMKKHGEVMCMLQSAFQHIVQVLRHVKPVHHSLTRQRYPNSDLALPLFKFSPAIKQPVKFEMDTNRLIEVTRQRVQALMNVYHEEKNREDIAQATKAFHNAILKDMTDAYSSAASDDEPLIDESLLQDRDVPTRNEIKNVSANIVEKNAKKDDD